MIDKSNSPHYTLYNANFQKENGFAFIFVTKNQRFLFYYDINMNRQNQIGKVDKSQ